MLKSWVWWILWALLNAAIFTYFGYQMIVPEQKPALLIGSMSDGHHQIELACSACHTDPFGGEEILQNACTACHAEELKTAQDAHPTAKFTNPRNADRIDAIDARFCVACHQEHNQDLLRPMGVSMPTDYCMECHSEIGEERDSHAGMEFETCASSGCHNFHDNRALYENFLLSHAGEPDLLDDPQLPSRDLLGYMTKIGSVTWEPSQDTPALVANNPDVAVDWAASAHGHANVSCSSCHGAEDSWVEKPTQESCVGCHQTETEGFLSGKHGMRIAAGLSPMTPELARLPMHEAAAHTELTCNSCHQPHSYDTQFAAVDACLGCHADEHSQSFTDSPHFALWEQAKTGEIPQEEAVTCATCHMPRLVTTELGQERVVVEHNQNSTLRPNEKMIRPVCMNCHGLQFSLDSLADPEVIQSNFSHPSTLHIPSVDMAVERDQ